jgi:hypothetical protein
MAVSSITYPSPVSVNGYACINCSEVELAEKRIDPRHPQSGRDNKDAAADPSRQATDPIKIEAAKRAADQAALQVSAYSPAGTVAGSIGPGSAFSISA